MARGYVTDMPPIDSSSVCSLSPPERYVERARASLNATGADVDLLAAAATVAFDESKAGAVARFIHGLVSKSGQAVDAIEAGRHGVQLENALIADAVARGIERNAWQPCPPAPKSPEAALKK
jgi:hypothetical protein